MWGLHTSIKIQIVFSNMQGYTNNKLYFVARDN